MWVVFLFVCLFSCLLGPKALGTSKKHSHTNRVKQIFKKPSFTRSQAILGGCLAEGGTVMYRPYPGHFWPGSPPWPSWHCGQDSSLLWGAVLCIEGCLTVSPSSTTSGQLCYPPPKLWQPKMSPDIVEGALELWHHPWLRTTASYRSIPSPSKASKVPIVE